MKNTPNTPLSIPNDIKDVDTSPTADKLHEGLVHGIFDRKLQITIKKTMFSVGITHIDDELFVVDRAYNFYTKARSSSNSFLYVNFSKLYPQVSQSDFNPANLDHLATNFKDCYQAPFNLSSMSSQSSSPTPPLYNFSDILTATKNKPMDYWLNRIQRDQMWHPYCQGMNPFSWYFVRMTQNYQVIDDIVLFVKEIRYFPHNNWCLWIQQNN